MKCIERLKKSAIILLVYDINRRANTLITNVIFFGRTIFLIFRRSKLCQMEITIYLQLRVSDVPNLTNHNIAASVSIVR